MVAAAKVKRAENKVKANRPYALELQSLFHDVYEAMKNQASQLDDSRYGELLTDRPIKKVGIVVISSDRGLCGSYNANIIKQAGQLDRVYRTQGIETKFYLVGNKIIRGFKGVSQSPVLGTMGNMTAAPTFADATAISHALVAAFHAGEIDAIQILYTRFNSMISYKAYIKPVFPLKGLIDEINHQIPPVEDGYNDTFKPSRFETHAELILEPDPVKVLDALIPLYLGNQFYTTLLEASASELAARMTAMSNASKNASDMISILTLQYNKARQASITQEILEIVSGANAL